MDDKTAVGQLTQQSSYYITTPIYYVNAAPHLGSAYTTVLADVSARYQRMMGKNVFFLTGVDEHGEKVAQAAHEHDMEPQAWCDELVGRFEEMNRALDITNDDFIRTTQQRHIQAVQHLWSVLKEKDYVYKGTYDGWYCVPDETYFTQTQVRHANEGLDDAQTPLCPDCGRPLKHVSETSWFFKLSAFEKPLLDLYERNPHFIEPEIRRNEVVSFVKSGLKDLSVSRSSFDWGIPLPFDDKHVTYVWFDALINYLTAVGYGNKSAAAQEEFAYRWPAQVQLVGKDIIRFHCVIWPALLMAAGLEVPHQIFAHGFLTVKNEETGVGEKMSKSRANVIAPQEVIDKLGVDGYRYYFMSDVKPGSDGAISLSRMEQVYNTDLANSWGNLVSRTLNMSAKYFDGKTPSVAPTCANPLFEIAKELPAAYCEAMETLAFDEACAHVMHLIHRANLYIEESEPWALVKDPQTLEQLAQVIANLLEAIRICAYLLMPFMPRTSKEVLKRMGCSHTTGDLLQEITWGGLPKESPVYKGDALFPRLTTA